MQRETIISIKLAALAIAALTTVAVMLHAGEANPDAGFILFLLWGISPYIFFLATTALLERFTSIYRICEIACVISVLMLAFTLLTYIGTLNDRSSTYGLIFIFVPIYLFVGSLGILIVSVIISLQLRQHGLVWVNGSASGLVRYIKFS